MLESLRNYLAAVLPLELGAAQYLRLFRTVFLLVFASSVLLHVLLEDGIRPLQTLSHATLIGASYTLVVGLACAIVYATRKATDQVRVWHIWLVSLVVFVAGYYFLPFDGSPSSIAGEGADAHAMRVSFFQLLPIWALATYFFIQSYLMASLTTELEKLRDVNALLEAGMPTVSDAVRPIRFPTRKQSFALNASSVRNIAVDDHYCFVHYRLNGDYEKRDLAMPLREILALLPNEFVQVHRSHVVNLRSIKSIRRENRSMRLVLDGGFEVPVSRYRLNQVLPLLHQQLALHK
ncbi:MAG: LytTR family DNA-binding domain-containing protein [Woeseiaceae bacterium]|nr:LytTR family DNA-binding domain-containing protein [Woeseiaceae bacterium]